MNTKPLNLAEAKGTINVVIFQELGKNPNINPEDLFNNMKNYQEYVLVQKLFPTLDSFIGHLKESNFIK